MVLVLFALSPADARPFYQSDLICLPQFEDYGFAVILHPSGSLHVTLQTAGPPIAGEPVQCQITCHNLAGDIPSGTTLLGPVDCGVTKSAGKVVFRAQGLGDVVGTFGPGALCRNPTVQVFNNTIDCTSGYPTPQ
jgi:hypothetical protein